MLWQIYKNKYLNIIYRNWQCYLRWCVIANNWFKILNLILINRTTPFRLFAMTTCDDICHRKYWSVLTRSDALLPHFMYPFSLSLSLPSTPFSLYLLPSPLSLYPLLSLSRLLLSPPTLPPAVIVLPNPLSLSISFFFYILFFVLFYWIWFIILGLLLIVWWLFI